MHQSTVSVGTAAPCYRSLDPNFEAPPKLRIAIILLAMLFGLASAMPVTAQPTMGQSSITTQPSQRLLRVYAVHVGDLYGVYLGRGLIITAAHVVSPHSAHRRSPTAGKSDQGQSLRKARPSAVISR